MSVSTKESERQSLNLNLGALKSVVWVKSNPALQYGFALALTPVDRARQYRLIDLVAALVTFLIGWTIAVIHTIPWPAFVIRIVHRVDELLEHTLEVVYQKLEWWFDYISVKLMWAFETLILYLDRLITLVDKCIDWLLNKYDWIGTLALKVYALGKGVVEWWMTIFHSIWKHIQDILSSMKTMWKQSQEDKIKDS